MPALDHPIKTKRNILDFNSKYVTYITAPDYVLSLFLQGRGEFSVDADIAFEKHLIALQRRSY